MRALLLRRVQVSVRDAQGRLLERRLLDGNGVRPSIQTLPLREVPAGTTLTVFNPFPSFGRDLRIASLHYEMTLSADAKGAPEIVRTIEVKPLLRDALTTLSLPMRGRLISYDGHDALAHHRRFDYSFAPLAQMGFKSNFMRYAYDFVPVDAIGASGSAFFPHLHYQLQDGPTLAAEGLPSSFSDLRVLRGASAQALKRATVDTGQIVESAR